MLKKKPHKIINFLDMPEEIISNEPKITILGFNKILIENYKGILEYEDFFIRINTTIGILNINGINLSLNQITEDDVLVEGKVENIELEKTEV